MSKFTPLNMPRSKCFGNNYYETFSVKLKRNVRLFSQLEYKNFLTLEMNPEILEFCEQPIKLQIEIDGTIENSILDMWVHYRNGTEEMQEVKYTIDLEQGTEFYERVKKQIQKQEQWCRINGYIYSIRTEKILDAGTYYINNLRYLYGLIKRLDIPLYRRYLKLLINILLLKRITVRDIVNDNKLPVESIFSTIALGIYEGQIEANIFNEIISYDTEIWLKDTYSTNLL